MTRSDIFKIIGAMTADEQSRLNKEFEDYLLK